MRRRGAVRGAAEVTPYPQGCHHSGADDPRVDDGDIPHPERHEMGQGDRGVAPPFTGGTAVVRRDPHGAAGARAAR